MKVNMYPADKHGCGYYRMYLPAKYIQRKAKDIELKVIEEQSHIDLLNNLDIMYLQRSACNELFKHLLYANKQGAMVLYDADDDFFNVPLLNPSYNYYNNEIVKANIETYLKTANCITVSTEYLKNEYKKYNKNVVVLPNSIDFEMWNEYYKQKKENKIVMIYPASPTHAEDIFEIVDVLIRVLKENPEVELHSVNWNFTKADIFDSVRNQVKHIPGKTPFEFGSLLTHGSIGIAPLAYNKFNRSKSNIKFLEYSALGIPTAATDITPYECIQEGITGFKIKKNDKNDWYCALTELIRNVEMRKSIGKQARDYVYENYNIEKNVDKWIEVFYTLLNK